MQFCSEKDERARNKQTYLRRIANRLSQDDTPYNIVFKRWEFVPDTKINVDFHKAKCGICDNSFLRHLYKIKPIEAYKPFLPEGSPQQYWVGSICVENFCHRDEKGHFVPFNKRGTFVKKITLQKKKEIFFGDLTQRIDDAINSDQIRGYPRLMSILGEIKRKNESNSNNNNNNKKFIFDTITDAIVFAVAMHYRSVKQLMKYGLKIAQTKDISFAFLHHLEGKELKYYSKCVKQYNDRSYVIAEIESDDEFSEISSDESPHEEIVHAD